MSNDFLEARLVEGGMSGCQGIDLGDVGINSDDAVSHLSEACGCDTTDITQSKHCDIRRRFRFMFLDRHETQYDMEGFGNRARA